MIKPDITLETALWQQGYLHVAGIDEAGRGPLAGPVTAGAVVIHEKNQVIKTVRDSKLMTKKQREAAFEQIIKTSSAYGIGIVSHGEIDEIGIDFAVKKAMLQALEEAEKRLGEKLSMVIVDGSKTKPLERYKSKRIKAGGLYHYTISAGSVLAKVTRDRLMKDLANEYPGYGFATHVGYGTKAHLAALKKLGVCLLHRKSYLPVKLALK